MGMSGVEVYESHCDPDPSNWYFDIVWRGKSRWAVTQPWDQNKYILVEIGCKLRNRAAQDEEIEKSLRQSEVEKAKREVENADTMEVVTRDVMRTVSDKPLYFYNEAST